MISDDMPLVQVAAVLISGLGALNWGLIELMEKNLLTDMLGLDASTAGLVYLVIGVAGLIVLVDLGSIVAEEGPNSTPLED